MTDPETALQACRTLMDAGEIQENRELLQYVFREYLIELEDTAEKRRDAAVIFDAVDKALAQLQR